MVETRASKKRRKSTMHVQFPQEIIVEILSKLPVKSLLQFTCVSKPWLALISSPEFVKLHLHSSTNDKEYRYHRVILRWCSNTRDCSLHSLLYSPFTEASVMGYPAKNFNFRWCNSVNGLICLAGTEKIDRPLWRIRIKESQVINLCIWNPSIKKCKILPRVTSKRICYTIFRYGFGYDELLDDYKIVVIFNMKVKIYSLKTSNSWRTVRNFQEGSLIDCSAKSVKGKLYWTSLTVNENNDYSSRNIISFDLANETWDKVEQPYYGEGKFNLMLGVLGSDLVVLCNYERHHSNVWVMNNYGVKSSWKKMFTISCPPDPRNYNFITHSSLSFSPFFCQSCQGEVLLLYRSVFMIYNPKEDSIRQVEVADLTGWFEAEIFVESLVNPLVGS